MLNNEQRYYLGNIVALARREPCDVGASICYPDSNVDLRDCSYRVCRLYDVCGCPQVEITPQRTEFYGYVARTTCNKKLIRQLDKMLLKRASEVVRKITGFYEECYQLKQR